MIEALALDDDLMNFYLDSLELRQQMDRIVRVPSDQAIQRILGFSYHYPFNQPANLSV
ncbi:hypothetical protein HNQ92_003066 [Rhabdobacter roseus]|uniref:Uncharacterized protein n=1 Tax=Rhabdobacter roseus TaxID=1655419 RepID=A0A840TXJ2_9BACT|nr:hypothetical protein [Rhabdobacter roseus]